MYKRVMAVDVFLWGRPPGLRREARHGGLDIRTLQGTGCGQTLCHRDASTCRGGAKGAQL